MLWHIRVSVSAYHSSSLTGSEFPSDAGTDIGHNDFGYIL